jgi:hypothetical protein
MVRSIPPTLNVETVAGFDLFNAPPHGATAGTIDGAGG